MSRSRDQEKKKKKKDSVLEAQILALLQKSLQTAIKAALKDIEKEFR